MAYFSPIYLSFALIIKLFVNSKNIKLFVEYKTPPSNSKDHDSSLAIEKSRFLTFMSY
jgi:hypothetical protein